jgi:hypothetical protein
LPWPWLAVAGGLALARRLAVPLGRDIASGVMGVTRAKAVALVSGVALASVLGFGVAAHGAGLTANAQPVQTPSPTAPADPAPATDPALTAPANPVQPAVRTGGSDPVPGRGKPGWVWWGAAAFALALVVGGFRMWRTLAG